MKMTRLTLVSKTFRGLSLPIVEALSLPSVIVHIDDARANRRHKVNSIATAAS